MNRLRALDVMRGLTVVLMIVVNTPVWGTPVYEALQHTLWNGLTAADLVFPLFVFMMGVSVSFSLRCYDYTPSRTAVTKVLRRTLLIFIVGLALDYVEKGIAGVSSGLDFSRLRLTGVLPRLALSYGVASLLALYIGRRGLMWAVVAMLAVYAAVLLAFKGFEPTVANIVSRVDVALLGENHIYHDWVPGGRIALDPEGLLGTLPSVAHVLIGYLCGRSLMEHAGGDPYRRITPLLLAGAALTIAGFALSYGIPLNKKVWSPTFVMVSCGMGALLLGLLIYAIDIRGYGRRSLEFFTVFGVNPLFLYILSSIAGVVMWEITVAGQALPAWLYANVLATVCGTSTGLASLVYSLLVVTLCWAVGLPLFRRRIYIKI